MPDISTIDPKDLDFLRQQGFTDEQIQKGSYTPPSSTKPSIGAGEALGEHAASGVLPGAAFAAAAPHGAAYGASLGAMIPGADLTGIPEAIGGIAGGLVTGGAASWAAYKAQHGLLNTVAPEFTQKMDEKLAQGAEEHPIASVAGDVLGNLPSMELAAPKLAELPYRAALGGTIGGLLPLAQGHAPGWQDLASGAANMTLFGKSRFEGESREGGEPNDKEQESEENQGQVQGPQGIWMEKTGDGYRINDKQVGDAFKKLNPPPAKVDDALNNPEYYAAKNEWDKLMRMPADEKRQALHDRWVAQQASGQETASEPLKMSNETIPQTPIDEAAKTTTTSTTGEEVPPSTGKEEADKRQEVADAENKEALPFAVNEGPNNAKEVDGKTEQTQSDLEKARAEKISQDMAEWQSQGSPASANTLRIHPPSIQQDVSKTSVPGDVDPVKASLQVYDQEKANDLPIGRTPEEELQDRMEGNGARYSEGKVDPSDLARFNELNQQRSKMLEDGTAFTPEGGLHPEYEKAWKEAEGIKNKYDGQTPDSVKSGGDISMSEGLPRHIVDHINSGQATTGSVIKMVAEAHGNMYQPLAKTIHENMDSASRRVPWKSNPFVERSEYQPPTKPNEFGHGDEVTMATLDAIHAPTVMEEAMHSILASKIPQEWANLRGSQLHKALSDYINNPKSNPHIKDLAGAYLDTAKALGIHEHLFGDKGVAGSPDSAKKSGLANGFENGYAMGSFDEFKAHAFVNRKFQEVLNKIQTTGNRTMWQRVVDAISHLLGVPVNQKSMLDRVLRSSSELIKQERPEGEVGKDSRSMGAQPNKNKNRAVNKPLSSTTSKDLGSWGSKFGSGLDNIRSIPHKGAKVLADAYQRALDYRQQLTGKYTNASLDAAKGLTARDKITLSKAIDDYRINKIQPKGLSPEADKWFKTNQSLIDQLGKEHIKNNVPIQGKDGQFRLMKQDPNYWPTMANQQVENTFRQHEDLAKMTSLQKEFTDYYQQKLGYTSKDAQAKFDNWKKAISGNMDGSGISHQDYFNALRKSQGDPLPPSFREQDPARNMSRYFDRAGMAMAHYTHVEANHKAIAALGTTKDAWGKSVQQYPEGGIANNKFGKAAVGQFHSSPKDTSQQTEEGASSLVTALFISSPGLEVHKLGSNFVKSVLYAPNPYVAVRAISHAIFNMREGWTHAKEGGLIKLSASSASDMLDSSLTTHQRMAGIAKVVRSISTLGGMTTKANAAYQQAYFENMLVSRISKANAGNVTSQRMLKHWDADYQLGKKYNQSELQQLASTAAAYVHGTGDIRQMPAWMMSESEISGFMQLAHWSVAQTNNFLHDVWLPAKKGNLMPLMTGLFGSAVAGYAIKELREKIQGKHGAIPSLQEIGNSEKGFEGNKSLLMYNAIAGMQYAGFGGLFSQVAKWPFDAAYKNTPQGLTFPLDEFTTDIASTIHNVTTAMANDPNVNYVDLAAAVAQHLLGSNIKLASIALNYGINNGLVTGLPAEKKQLADKLGQLRRFDMVTGLPYNEIDQGSNPYMNIEQKKFKMEQDIPTAMKELPALVSNIMQTYQGQPDIMMQKLKALKENQYSTFPSMEQTPISFIKYLGYLQREEGPDKAQGALMDYMCHKMVNEAKASVVP